MTTDTIHNYRAVDAFLATAGQPTEVQLGSIANEGYAVVINLALHNDPRYSLPDEAGTVRALGMEYVHIPVQFATPTESDALAFFDAMDKHAGKKVFVHCAANMRVTAFLGLYRIVRKGWLEKQAFELMKTVWEPNDVWSGFIEKMVAKRG
ncbi:MAG: protein tyrosine phosphatase family protein [Candidatus Obscuribacterales bacterium]|nr:protein tyrosine phosphatase family protein [Steroidobacteraceae bacterium]